MNTNDGALDLLARRSLDQIATAAAALLDVPLVLISVLEGDRQTYVGAHGLARTRTEEQSPLCRDVATGGRPIVLQDVRRRLPGAAGGRWGFALVGYAGVALKLRDPSRTGALAALTPARRGWQSVDLRVLRSLADAAAAVLEIRAGCEKMLDDEQRRAAREIEIASVDGKRRTHELEATSIRDELTGLLNRRGLFAIAPAQLDAVHRHSIGGLLIYVDLDGLKQTNDRHGHSAGDDLLRSAATALRASFRDADTIARLGGDEFLVIVTETAAAEQPAILARLAAELDRVNQRRDPMIPLAWSVGLVTIEPAEAATLDSLMAVADQRMYAAKRTLHDL